MLIQEIMDIIVQTLIIPAVLALCGYLLIIIKSYARRVTDSIVEKNDIENINIVSNLKSSTMSQIDMITKAVVASLMPRSKTFKAGNGDRKLTKDQASMLKNQAISKINHCLPANVTCSNGNLNSVIGGINCYEYIVDELIEKHVLEYNNKWR